MMNDSSKSVVCDDNCNEYIKKGIFYAYNSKTDNEILYLFIYLFFA